MSYNSPFSGAEVDDAVTKRHEKNKDTKLDEGGTNETTAQETREHIDATDNPHGVTKTQVGLGDVDNVSAADLRDRSTHTGTQNATTVDYNNATSGLSATDVQNAIDEVASSGDAADVTYDNTASGLSATDVQAAIDELSAGAVALVRRPTNISPAQNETGTLLKPELQASNYGSLYSVPMASAQWQISEVSDFSTTVVDETVAGTSTTYTPSNSLDPNSQHFWRVQYADDDGEVSEFSEATKFTTANIFTEQPIIISPSNNETDIGETPTITSSAFNTVNGSDTHEASQWIITRVSDGVDVFNSGEDTTNLESIDIPAGVLNEGQESYTVKVRHKGQTFGFSAYSTEITFVTQSEFFDYTDPANIGTPIHGGYLVGVIDTIIGTIDPADDYQTGERYALIVSSQSLQENNIKWDAQQRGAENGSLTRWDGLSSTNNILDKNDTSYEAFEHIRSIRSSNPVPSDGGSDWYLPAMDELELIFRNLKPSSFGNNVGDTGGVTFPTGSSEYGFNPSSDPTGAAYTASGEPFQTSVVDFQEGGAEFMSLDRFLSSSDVGNNQRAWAQRFGGSFGDPTGELINIIKDATSFQLGVRPVRRIAL